jgi:hypothetical protein
MYVATCSLHLHVAAVTMAEGKLSDYHSSGDGSEDKVAEPGSQVSCMYCCSIARNRFYFNILADSLSTSLRPICLSYCMILHDCCDTFAVCYYFCCPEIDGHFFLPAF